MFTNKTMIIMKNFFEINRALVAKKKIFTLFVAALCCASMFAEDYALPGKFTVNADGAQVRFSQQAILRRGANHSIFTISSDQFLLYSYNYSSYFAWGTGDDPGYTSYKTDFVDWGDYLLDKYDNPITQQFRTLSADEWQYLLSGRENATFLCGLAQITNQAGYDVYNGLILFPEDAYAYKGGTSLKFSDDLKFEPYIRTNEFTYGYNEYTYEQWKQLEAHGAVFLQAATICQNNQPYQGVWPSCSEMKDVYYWTSTGAGGGSTPSAKALYISEQSNTTVNTALQNFPRSHQLTVRLVHDVQAGEGIENIATPSDKARKVMMDGTLYIALPDGKIYNATGAEMK